MSCYLKILGMATLLLTLSPSLSMGQSALETAAAFQDTTLSVGEYRIEKMISTKRIAFRVTRLDGTAVATKKAQGKITLHVAQKRYDFSLTLAKDDTLGIDVDLQKAIGFEVRMAVELVGIGDKPLVFETSERILSGLSDALVLSLQKTCPISGKPLVDVKSPPKVQHEGKTLFVCCGGCAERINASPEQYFDKVYSEKGRELRPGVFETTLADAEAIAAQKMCPVLDEPLGSMGPPQKVEVGGKAVYICCVGCAKFVLSEPKKVMATITRMGVNPPPMWR